MSIKVFSDIFVSDVLVDHPYEPALCRQVKADILIFRDSHFGSVYDVSTPLALYLFGSISRSELFSIYGIFIVYLFHDLSLRSSTFSICKDFFDSCDATSEYDYYFRRYVSSEEV